MRVFTPLLAALASGVLAQVKSIAAVKCFTKLSPTSGAKVSTVSLVLTLPLYATKKQTVTPTLTITPPPITNVVASLVTQTNTVSNTQVTTITDSATTIATTAGFVPIESSFPNSGDTSDAPAGKRSFVDNSVLDMPLVARAGGISCTIQNGKPVISPAAYPSGVLCAGAIFVVSTKTTTLTAKTTATTTLPPSTVFTTSVSTTTTTVTTGVTNTVIVPNPTPTYYAACADNNIIDTAQGSLLAGFNAPDATFGSITGNDASSPYDCCVACQTYATFNGGIPCSNSYFVPPNFCYLVVGAGCSPKSAPVRCTGGDCGYFASNGCNQITAFGPNPINT